ncbi:MAG: hypothetical protein WB507_06025 [Solirubrobacterales bacterium]
MKESRDPIAPLLIRALPRALLALPLVLVLAVALTACGEGAGSTSSTPALLDSTATAATRAPTVPATKRPRRASNPSRSSGGRARQGSAPFRTPTGDNSIPDYGSEAPASKRADVTAALRSYLLARAAGRWSAACSYMGAAVRNQAEVLAGELANAGRRRSCLSAYAKLAARVSKAQRANPLGGGLAALRVKGEKAFALFYGPHDQKYMIPMVHEGGAWKVNQLDPIPYPIAAPPVR